MRLIFAGILTTAVSSLTAQEINKGKIAQSYKESCTKQQVQLHAKLKDMSADAFSEYCDCTSQQLMTNLSSAQLKGLNHSGDSPAWLKSAEQSASKVCLKEGPKTQI
ncbi:hypothetical protein ICN42_08855 [Polynucleobacter sp. 71A-WALBACH]|uniref:hypothetical protein n=1 Tax=Polynucleobacter sp. 71A-WALBACH TaxID=2689097 RepID=UPI001C0E28B3|nr:hypothetical protein [Polynucleobacter sp. 71A-WALBACH]MBU3594201.1 hypothetical protein [Polynucleobacter sp. 71A-WALBACH]